jgi:hypothetical protein
MTRHLSISGPMVAHLMRGRAANASWCTNSICWRGLPLIEYIVQNFLFICRESSAGSRPIHEAHSDSEGCTNSFWPPTSIQIGCDTLGFNYTSATISRVVSILGLTSLDPEGLRSIADDRVVNEKDRKSASTPSGSSAKAIRLFYKANQGLDHAVYRESWPL